MVLELHCLRMIPFGAGKGPMETGPSAQANRTEMKMNLAVS